MTKALEKTATPMTVEALAAQVVKHMPGWDLAKFTVGSEDDSRCYTTPLHRKHWTGAHCVALTDGVRFIWFTRSNDDKTKIVVSPVYQSMTDHDNTDASRQLKKCEGTTYLDPPGSIMVTAARGPEAVAKDIMRRLVPAYVAEFARLQVLVDEIRDAETERGEQVKYMQRVMEGKVCGVDVYNQNVRADYADVTLDAKPDSRYIDGKGHTDGFYKITLGQLSKAQFEAVVKAVKGTK